MWWIFFKIFKEIFLKFKIFFWKEKFRLFRLDVRYC